MRDEKREKASLPRFESASASPPHPSSLIPHPFTKMQAVGNDFVVVEEAAWPPDTDWSAQAITLCDRKFSIGADGLIIVSPSEAADVRMRFYNPDGTEDMCGNGLRCLALFVAWKGYLPTYDFAEMQRRADTGKLTTSDEWDFYGNAKRSGMRRYACGKVETIAGIRRVQLDVLDIAERGHKNSRNTAPVFVRATMGNPRFSPEELPMEVSVEPPVVGYPLPVEGYGTVPVSVVFTGSTHTVVWVEELPDDSRFFDLSPRIEHHPLFPARTSVLWAKIVPEPPMFEYDQSHAFCIELRIWERGVGETLGCGTGACAAAVLAIVEHRIEDIEWGGNIRSKGGKLRFKWDDDGSGEMELWGPAEIVYEGSWTGGSGDAQS